MPTAPIPRPSARVLLVSPEGRVLLFSSRMSDFPGRTAWFTPGGGVRDGESLAAAAARELAEVTGQVVPAGALGPVVAVCSGEWSAGDRVFAATDSYFFVRAATVHVDTSGHEELERSVITGHRWWGADAIDATADVVLPLGLAALLRGLLTRGVPDTPVRLPWRPGG